MSKVDSLTESKHESDTEVVAKAFPRKIAIFSAYTLFSLGAIVSLTADGESRFLIGALTVPMAIVGGMLANHLADVLRKIHNKF